MTDSECAERAYDEIRLAIVPGSKPMPLWRDLQETERELLVRMFVSGAVWSCREVLEPKHQLAK